MTDEVEPHRGMGAASRIPTSILVAVTLKGRSTDFPLILLFTVAMLPSVSRSIPLQFGLKQIVGTERWFLTLGPQMFLVYISWKTWPEQWVVKDSRSFSPRTSGDPRLGTVGIASMPSAHLFSFAATPVDIWASV